MASKNCLLAVVPLLCLVSTSLADEAPPDCVFDGSCVATPIDAPDAKGPAIGIDATPYSNGEVTGVLVVRDKIKRKLWYKKESGQKQAAYFRVNEDVILKVNGHPIRSAADVLRHTHESYNKLTIRDLRTKATGDYFVELP
jgi:hypothetical protein